MTSTRRARGGRDHAADRVVVGVLRALLERLEASLGEVRVPTPDGPAPDRWKDEEYVYLEVGLPRGLGPDIDINVHADRALIRIGV